MRQLIAEGEFDVHVLDNLASGRHRLEAMDRGRFALHEADIRDDKAVADVMRRVEPTVIFHLAALHYIPACEAAPGIAASVNVAGTINILSKAPAKSRFIFASTAAVYSPSAEAHREDDIGSGPVDIYGLTKLHGEHFVRYYHQSGAIRGTIVRLFNVVGSGETNPHLAPAIIEQLASGDTQLRLGNLFPRRDYIDVEDAAKGFRLIANSSPHDGSLNICNLGTGRDHEVGDVVQLIADASGLGVSISQDPGRVRAADRPVLRASVDRLRRLTGWSPQIDLKTSMRNAWATRAEDKLR
ncbi:MAG: NAD-dependent epimerase/dehydratase family protein [Alphaproteobacteria bacterium]|nr:NAD-dependent epimerase/dehydratase family protein [Alphaproteobacteria bacterium]